MDVITHVSDLFEFRKECIILVDAKDEDGTPLIPQLIYDVENETIVYGVTKIPVHYETISFEIDPDTGESIPTMVESLTLIRIDSDEQLQHFNHMHRLGLCVDNQYVFDSQDSQDTYERVRGDLNYTYTDDSGAEHAATKPYMIGVFA